jgi:hypothetical protein
MAASQCGLFLDYQQLHKESFWLLVAAGDSVNGHSVNG